MFRPSRESKKLHRESKISVGKDHILIKNDPSEISDSLEGDEPIGDFEDMNGTPVVEVYTAGKTQSRHRSPMDEDHEFNIVENDDDMLRNYDQSRSCE